MRTDWIIRKNQMVRCREKVSQHRLAQHQAREQFADDGRLSEPAHQIGQQTAGKDEQSKLCEQIEDLLLSQALQMSILRSARSDLRFHDRSSRKKSMSRVCYALSEFLQNSRQLLGAWTNRVKFTTSVRNSDCRIQSTLHLS